MLTQSNATYMYVPKQSYLSTSMSKNQANCVQGVADEETKTEMSLHFPSTHTL